MTTFRRISAATFPYYRGAVARTDLFGAVRLTSGKRSGCSIDSTAKSNVQLRPVKMM